jgi:crotonobetainyl-CoA:carnitine CoA-transferase CaiB-like acyl-CoA transferase
MAATNGARSRPLAGVRVLDASTMLAGPAAATLLADWGADVIKLEMPGPGDHARAFGARAQGEGLYWKSLARNKRSVAFDLRVPEAQALLRRWLPQVDVLIENFRPGTFERWNLAPAELRALAPRLVVARVTAFGQEGPYREKAGFGTLAEAMTGIASVSGWEDRPPLLPPFALADLMAAYLTAGAISAALVRQRTTGQGETIDIAIYEAVMRLMESQIMEYGTNGTLHRRRGNQMDDTAPRGAYRCADGKWLALSGSTQTVAQRVLRAIGGERLLDDPRFRTNVERVENADALDALIGDWCGARTAADAIAELSALGCAAGPLESVDTMFENPQVVARGSIVTVDDDVLGPLRMTNAFPAFLESAPAEIVPGPSAVGAHTREVLGELGLAPNEIEALAAAGAVALPPEHAGTAASRANAN